eukprot:NODE_21_length_42443_cov_0.822808.p16 type:complete len:298 gc:universal NODE_21_length_42443_cov_0.822808:21006-21899(+)
MLVVKYKQRMQKLKHDTKAFEKLELSTEGKRESKINLNHDSKVKKLEYQIALEKQKNKELDMDNSRLSSELSDVKIALREATLALRTTENKLNAKIRSKITQIPVPIKSSNDLETKNYALCQHIQQKFEKDSEYVRESLINKIRDIFDGYVIKTSKLYPSLDEFLSQKDVALITFKVQSTYNVYGLFSGNIRIETSYANIFEKAVANLPQLEYHNNMNFELDKFGSYVLRLLSILKPQSLIIFSNRDLKFCFGTSKRYIYTYSIGVLYYEDEKEGSIFMYPHATIKIKGGESFCNFH